MANKQEKFSFSPEVTIKRMGIGGYVYECPTTQDLTIVRKLPKEGAIFTCSCGKTHKSRHGNVRHFSHYL